MKKILLLAVVVVARCAAVPARRLRAGWRRGLALRGPNNPAPTSPVTGSAANGKALYYSYACYACHGYNGETGARAFVGRWGNLATEEAFITFLRGRANVAPIVPVDVHAEFRRSALCPTSRQRIFMPISGRSKARRPT